MNWLVWLDWFGWLNQLDLRDWVGLVLLVGLAGLAGVAGLVERVGLVKLFQWWIRFRCSKRSNLDNFPLILHQLLSRNLTRWSFQVFNCCTYWFKLNKQSWDIEITSRGSLWHTYCCFQRGNKATSPCFSTPTERMSSKQFGQLVFCMPWGQTNNLPVMTSNTRSTKSLALMSLSESLLLCIWLIHSRSHSVNKLSLSWIGSNAAWWWWQRPAWLPHFWSIKSVCLSVYLLCVAL